MEKPKSDEAETVDSNGGDLSSLNRLSGSETELRGAGYVLREAVEKLMACAGDIADADDETLEEAAESGYAPEIREQAEAFLLARNALRMTNYLFPPNVEARNGERR